MRKRIISLLCAVALLVGLMPTVTWAADTSNDVEISDWIDVTLPNPKVGWGKDGNYDITWYVMADEGTTTFTLYDAADLAGLAVIVNGTYQMTGDETWNDVPAEIALTDSTDSSSRATSTLQDTFEGKTIILAPGVTFDLSGRLWIPIGYRETFKGTFLGNSQYGTKITNMVIQTNSGNVGLFGTTTGADIENVSVENAKITAKLQRNETAGGIVGSLEGQEGNGEKTGSIKNCSFSGTIDIQESQFDTFLGGIVGRSGWGSTEGNVYSSSIENCISYAKITGGAYWTGGIVGQNGCYIEKAEANVKNCQNYGDIEVSRSTYVGGIVGHTMGDITACENYGSLSSTNQTTIGGIAGRMNTCTISDCSNNAAISQSYTASPSTGTGGSTDPGDGSLGVDAGEGGSSGDDISTVVSGGIVGHIDIYHDNEETVITNCHNSGSITAQCLGTNRPSSAYAGGVIGEFWVTPNISGDSVLVSQCSNTGDISTTGSGWSEAGGLVSNDYAECTFLQCYNSGNVTASTQKASSYGYAFSYAGGLASEAEGTYQNCYNVGNVKSESLSSATRRTVYAGGLAGNAVGATLTNCYNAGMISSEIGTDGTNAQRMGGIAGNLEGEPQLINCVYWNGCVTAPTNNNGIAKTANEMTEDHVWSNTNYMNLSQSVWTKQYNNLTGTTLIGYLPVLISNRQSPDPYLIRTPKADASGSLSITPDSLTLSETETATLNASGASGSITWFTRDESVAKVSGSGNTATVTAVGPGKTEIIAAIPGNDSQNDIMATVSVTVNGAPITSVSIDGLTAPVQGEKPVGKTDVTANGGCTVQSVSWKEDGSAFSGIFNAGKTYTTEIKLQAATGHPFGNTVTVTLPGTTEGTYTQPSSVGTDGSLTVTVTFNPVEHKHNWENAPWSFDEIYHWRECTNDGCDIKDFKKPEYGYDRHTDDGTGKCTVCGATIGYSITLDYNDGDSTPDQVLYTNIRGKLTSLPVPTRSGYEFLGWFTEADGGTQVQEDNGYTGAQTIYAHWSGTTISYVTLRGLVAPVQWDKPGYAIALPENVNYSLFSFSWYEEGAYLNPYMQNYFDFGKNYKAEFTLNAAGNFTFTENVNVTLENVAEDTYTSISADRSNNNKTLTVTVTFNPVAHKHSVTEETRWTTTATQHYKICTWEGCDAQYKTPEGYGMLYLGDHVDNGTGKCEICGRTIGYEIIFNANGGYIEGGRVVSVYTDMNGRLSDLPADPTYTGWFFDGWYDAPDDGNLVTKAEILNKTFDSRTTYYAHWKQESISKITVYGLEAPAVGAYPKTTSLTVPDGVNYSWRSNVLITWEDSSGNKLSVKPFEYGEEYSVKFYLNADNGYNFGLSGDTVDVTDLVDITLGNVPKELYTVTSAVQKKTGSFDTYYLLVTVEFEATEHQHEFEDEKPWQYDKNYHWHQCTDPDCTAEEGKVDYAEHSYYSDMPECRVCGYFAGGYKVTFNANGGSVDTEYAYTDQNGTLNALPTPTRDKYRFLGWYTAETGGSQVTSSYVFSGETTIYAHWEYIESYSISVDYAGSPSGGTITTSQSTAAEGETITLTVKPEEGYQLVELVVKSTSGDVIETIDLDDSTTYTFTMPNRNVTVVATFASGLTIIGLPGSITTDTAPFTLEAVGGIDGVAVEWSSNDEDVATVQQTDSNTARVTIKGPGTVEITAKQGSEETSVEFTVTGSAIDNVTVYGLTQPKAGETPVDSLTVENGKHYTFQSIEWKDESGSTPTAFEANDKYTAVITLEAEVNYLFQEAERISINLNGLDQNSYSSLVPELSQDKTTLTITVAFPEVGHTHTPSDKWSYDKIYHWKICTEVDCAEQLQVAMHKDNGTGECSVCGAVIGYKITLYYDEDDNTKELYTDVYGKLTNLPVNPQKDGYSFVGWFDKYDRQVDENTVFGADSEIYARWTQNQLYEITIETSGHGSITAVPNPAEEGAQVKLTVAPENGYELENLIVQKAQGGFVGVDNDKFTMPADDVTIQASFAPVSAKLTISGLPAGTIKVGDAFRLTASGGSASGDVTWWSGSESVAVVDQNGFVTAKGPGTVVIFAQRGGETAQITVIVSGLDIDTVEIQNLIAPVAGETPQQTIKVPLNANYGALTQMGVGSTELDVQWTDSTGALVTEFKEGEEYSALIVLAPKGNYTFAQEVEVVLESLKEEAYKDITATVNADGNLEVVVQFGVSSHQHSWNTGDNWSSDGLHHWHACTADGCPLLPSGMHDYDYHTDDGSGYCAVCGEKIGYTIWFDANGGTVFPESALTNIYGKLTSLPDPTRSRYRFDGWFTERSGGTEVTVNTEFDGNTTVYAHWTKISSGSGSSSGSEASTNPVIVKETEHGIVDVSPKSASRGKEVTITVTPDEGYELAALTVADKNGKEIDVTDEGNGKYTFKMPDSEVEITAVFQEITEKGPDYDSCWGGEDCPMWGFTDLNIDLWYHDGIHFCLDEGLMAGTGADIFSPGETTSRGMIVAILYRLAGSPAVEGENPFTDVAEGQYYRNAVVWAVGNDIVSGYGDGIFGPNDPIIREQLAVMLYNYAKVFDYDTTVLSAAAQAYSDFNKTSVYAETALNWAVDVGIIHGMGDGTLAPQGQATRAEAATMLMNFCENVVK